MAKYRPAESRQKPAVLVVVQYPDTKAVTAAHTRFTAALLPDAKDGHTQQEDETWLGCQRFDKLLVIVADAADRETAQGLIETFGRLR